MAARRPSFFKVLIGNHFSDKLKIPGAFLRHFDGAVPAPCQLRIGTQTWAVDVEMVHHKFYFQNGWKEFVHDNDLKGCEFLVFFYNGNSEFTVDIYGKDACKREFTGVAREVSDSPKCNYVASSREMEEFDSDDTSFEADDDDVENEADSESEDEYEYEDEEEVESDGDEGKSDDSIEILDKFPRLSKANPMRKSSGFDNGMINRSKAKEQSSMTRASGSSSNQMIKGLKPDGIAELIARQRANGFISKTAKPCCSIVMCPSSVHGSFLHIPSNFANIHLRKRCSHITLQVNNRSRCLRLYHVKESVRLQTGWAKFVRENSLKKGDVCVFVLTDKVQYVFDVTIFHATEASSRGRKTTGVFKSKKSKAG